MKKDLALTLVDHWKKNSKLIEVPGLAAYMKAQGSYFPPNIPTKIWIGTYNRLASAALWDGHFTPTKAANTDITAVFNRERSKIGETLIQVAK